MNKTKLGLLICVILVIIAYRPVTRWLVTPNVVNAPWVEKLEYSVYSSSYEEIENISKSINYSYPPLVALLHANDQKRRLFSIAKSKQGNYGLFRRSSTVEGRPIFSWLIVEDGSLKYIYDCTRDDGANAAQVEAFPVKNLRLGFKRDYEFIEGEPIPKDTRKIVLEIELYNHEMTYFD